MHKIDTENRNAQDEFNDEDLSQGIPATDLNAAFFNTIQRELCNAVTNAGLALSKTDDSQLWKAMQLLAGGITCAFIDGNYTIPAGKNKSTVLYYAGFNNFSIEGEFADNSMVVVIPESGAKIKVDYNGGSFYVEKGSIYIGIAVNGAVEGLQVVGTCVPKDFNGAMNIRSVRGEVVAADSFIDNGVVRFSKEETEEGLQPWQQWQLYSNWAFGAVKRVICTDAAVGGSSFIVYKNTSGAFRNVTFYPDAYREFLCVGSYTSGGQTFAVLIPNGKADN